MNKSESRRWELIVKEVNKTITSEEAVELQSLQKAVLEQFWQRKKPK